MYNKMYTFFMLLYTQHLNMQSIFVILPLFKKKRLKMCSNKTEIQENFTVYFI